MEPELFKAISEDFHQRIARVLRRGSSVSTTEVASVYSALLLEQLVEKLDRGGKSK